MRAPVAYIGTAFIIVLCVVVFSIIMSFLFKLALLAAIAVGLYYLYARARFHLSQRNRQPRYRRYDR